MLQEQIETPVETTAVTPVNTPTPGASTLNAEDETEENIEMPPPMKEIHTVLPSQPSGSQENVVSRILELRFFISFNYQIAIFSSW